MPRWCSTGPLHNYWALSALQRHCRYNPSPLFLNKDTSLFHHLLSFFFFTRDNLPVGYGGVMAGMLRLCDTGCGIGSFLQPGASLQDGAGGVFCVYSRRIDERPRPSSHRGPLTHIPVLFDGIKESLFDLPYPF